MKLLVVRDESSKILGHRWLNSQISFYIGLLQLSICIWAMAQHLFSLITYHEILFCDFVNGTQPVLLVGVDIIIFDVGLFHSLWGIDSCVAQHLDGGYGRFGWCFFHITAFVICLPFAFVSRPKPYSLWPLLIQQSAYGVGLLILSLAALPRVLPTFTGDENSASLFSVSVYAAGASLNFLLLYVYWHWYWHVEVMWNSVRKLRSNRIIINPNIRSKRTMIRHIAPHETNTSNTLNPYDGSNEQTILTAAAADATSTQNCITDRSPLVPAVNDSTTMVVNTYKEPKKSNLLLHHKHISRNSDVRSQQAERYTLNYAHQLNRNKHRYDELRDDRLDSPTFIRDNLHYTTHVDRQHLEHHINSSAQSASSLSSTPASLSHHLDRQQAALCRYAEYSYRISRRTLPFYHQLLIPIDRYVNSANAQLSSVPSSIPLHPLSFVDNDFVASAQSILNCTNTLR